MTGVLHKKFFTAGSARRVLGCAAVLLGVMLAACGKRGDPLAPLRLVPEAPTEVSLRRSGDKAVLKLTLPNKNENGPGPGDIDHVEIYAVTAAPGVVPLNRVLLSKTHVVGTVSVKPPPSEDEPPDPNAIEDKRPSPGDAVTFSEELTSEKLTPAPVETPAKSGRKAPEAASQPAAAAPSVTYPVRIYVLRGVTRSGRSGNPTPRLELPLVALPSPPAALVTLFDEKGVLIAWLPPVIDDAALMSMLPIVPVDAVLAAPMGTSEASTAATMALLAILPAEPATVMANPLLGSRAAGAAVTAPATAAATAPSPAAAPVTLSFNVYAAAATTPLNTAPLAGGSFQHAGAEFGKEQCFTVRTVRTIAAVAIEGEPSRPICVTPRDVFPPAAPGRLNAVAGPGAMNLIWDANTEPDLAGYIVLRGEAPGGTLQPLTAAPIRETNYRDATVKPGVRYVYVVVAVDNATPPNTSPMTTRVEETAR